MTRMVTMDMPSQSVLDRVSPFPGRPPSGRARAAQPRTGRVRRSGLRSGPDPRGSGATDASIAAALFTRTLLLAPMLLAVLLLTGCSMQRIATGSMVPVMEASLAEAYSSRDVETAREAIPGQILLLRGLCRSAPDRVELWTGAVQLYASYAMTFVENDDPARAVRLYGEGLDLGMRFLMRHDWFAAAWEGGPDRLRETLADRRPVDMSPILMWTAACLGQWILAHLDNPRVLADLSFAYVLVDAAIAMTPEYFHGMPYVLKGILLSITPVMLGGDLEASRVLFESAFRVTEGRFLYHKVLFARYHSVAALDEDTFTTMLESVLDAPKNALPEAELINLIAKQQAETLLAEREYLF